MKTTLSMAILLLASTAHASILGDWSGWGEWKYDGSPMHCGAIHLNFDENEKQLTRTAGSFDCDIVSMDLPPITLDKSGSNLIVDQKVVGNFAENHYHWIEPYSSTVHVEVLIDRSADHLDYHERWINLSGQMIYDIDARLFLHE
jgi:hypothetical protein